MLALWWMAGCTEKPEETTSPDTGTDSEDTDTTGPTDTDTGDTDTGTDPSCTPEALPDSFAMLALSFFGDLNLTPGYTMDLSVYAVVNGGDIREVALCETWSVEPPTPGITIDASGGLSIDPSVPDGTEVTITATLPEGAAPDWVGQTLSVGLLVYEPALRPWVGVWREETQLDCETGEERAPEQNIEEIQIKANGEVLVTWTPFELYVDWWGDGAWDLAAGTLSLTPTGGNYTPTDVDGEGTFAIDGDELVLYDLWLGTPREGVAPAGCGHRLR